MTDGLQNEELKFLEWICAAGAAGFSAILWGAWNMLVTSIKNGKEICDQQAEDIRKDFDNHRVLIAKEYTTKDDLKDVIKDFKETLNGFSQRMDNYLNLMHKDK